ncbi:hypothetical protein SDC9_141674 [bioreactor metagenome]|uniref:Uncharacterized protein n=1 Tax=bioreactor metagenome TaxID=1076179 RepID=A0A645DZG6_9ZZZZ
MGVGADDDLSRRHKPFFGQQGVLHAHLAHIIKVSNMKALGKITRCGAELRCLDVLAGGVMIQHNSDFILVEDAGETRLVEFGDGDRRCDVVA